MLPTWVGVVMAISLAVLALAAIVVAAAALAAALGLRAVLRALEQFAGPTISDVRQLVAAIRAEVDGLVGTSQDIRRRIVRAADAAEQRLADLDALVEVVQEEVDATALDVISTFRNVRQGLAVSRWVGRVLKRPRRPR